MEIRCTHENGWHVVADWFGEIRIVFMPRNVPNAPMHGPHGLEILDIRDCREWVRLNSNCACGAYCEDGICTAQELGDC